MRVAVWRTGHEIADTVAEALEPYADKGIAIGYGILRGMAEHLRGYDAWFEVDRGYFKPRHYDGYYRISLRGTQQTKVWPEPNYERLAALKLDVKPWRGLAPHLPVLICPPTPHVQEFFNIGNRMVEMPQNATLRKKGDTSPINFSDYNYVMTFNSSVGWQALQAGIPCVSDPIHSMVGNWFHTKYGDISLDELADKQLQDRYKLFTVMSNLQFTLDEIRHGKACPLISQLLSLSAMMAGKPLPATLPNTASAAGLKHQFQSNI